MNHEIATNLIELSHTGLEGLEYVRKRSSAGFFENTVSVFTQVVEAFSEIEKTLLTHLTLSEDDMLFQATESLRDALDWMTAAYEGDKGAKPMEIMQFTLVPRYEKWQRELYKTLELYLQ